MWVYVKSEPNLWTVGYYNPRGEWITDSDHNNRDDAATRVNYLNSNMGRFGGWCDCCGEV